MSNRCQYRRSCTQPDYSLSPPDRKKYSIACDIVKDNDDDNDTASSAEVSAISVYESTDDSSTCSGSSLSSSSTEYTNEDDIMKDNSDPFPSDLSSISDGSKDNTDVGERFENFLEAVRVQREKNSNLRRERFQKKFEKLRDVTSSNNILRKSLAASPPKKIRSPFLTPYLSDEINEFGKIQSGAHEGHGRTLERSHTASTIDTGYSDMTLNDARQKYDMMKKGSHPLLAKKNISNKTTEFSLMKRKSGFHEETSHELRSLNSSVDVPRKGSFREAMHLRRRSLGNSSKDQHSDHIIDMVAAAISEVTFNSRA